MKIMNIICGVVLFVFYSSLTAQNAISGLHDSELINGEQWHQITSSREVTCLIEDNGFLWIGTSNGLRRMTLTTHEQTWYNTLNTNLPSPWITQISADKNHNIWALLRNNGLAKFDGKNWVHYSENNSGLADNDVSCLEIDELGAVWLGHRKGIIKFDGRNWSYYDKANSELPESGINRIKKDLDCNLWFLGNEYLSKFDGLTLSQQTKPTQGQSLDFSNMFFNSKGGHWLISYDEAFYNNRYNWVYYPMDIIAGEPFYHSLTDITVDQSDDVWLGSECDGLYRYNGLKWISYDTSNSPLNDNVINCVIISSDNTKWIGTNSGLVSIIDGNWTYYNNNLAGLPTNDVTTVAFDKQNIAWIGTQDFGIIKYDGSVYTEYNVQNSPLTSNQVNDIAFDSKDRMWVGTENGLACLDADKWTIYSADDPKVPIQKIWNIEIDKLDNIWILESWLNNPRGLVKFDGKNWTTFNKLNSSIPFDNIEELAVGGMNTVWVGAGNGLASFDGVLWKQYCSSEIPIKSDYICAIGFEGNNTWISTLDEFARFNGKDWIVFDSEDYPILSDFAISINLDNKDIMWFGCSCQVVYYDGLNWKCFDSDNSPLFQSSFYNPVVVDRNNNKWILSNDECFGTGTGITIYNENGIIGW